MGKRVMCFVAAGLLAFGCSDDGDAGPTTTTATTTPDVTTSPPPTLSPSDVAFVAWPDPGSTLRYDDPVEAAAGFAVDLVGFTDPIVGSFLQGDSRSGEVEVRPSADGPVTTVLVRQFGEDGSWWVLGSLTADIEVSDPVAQGAIDHPLQVSGRARAFEGTVGVNVLRDGTTEPIGSGFVTGSGGDTLGPFSGSIPFESPSGGWGAVVFFTTSAEDGRVWQATVVRVGFIGGD